MKVIEIIFYFSAPLLIIKSLQRYKQFGFISPILLCYLVGIILGNQQLIPVNRELALSLSELAIPIAIPLILFSTDLKSWLKLAPKTILSFVCCDQCHRQRCCVGLLFLGWKNIGKSPMLVGVHWGTRI